MAQIDFYVLPENGKREYFSCALIQKVWKQGNNIYINMCSESAANTLDDLLWTFKDISFLPHCLASEDSSDKIPIVIGYNNPVPDHTSVIINLADEIPLELNKAERILEIVAGSEDERKQARRRYADYRNQGHLLNKHTIESSYGS